MSKKSEHSNVKLLPVGDSQPMALNIEALHAAKRSLDQGALTPSFGPWRADIVKLLNDSLATELVCVALQAPPLHRARAGIVQNCGRILGACQ
jgi:bacterioferritin